MLTHLAHLFAAFSFLLSAEASLPEFGKLSLPGVERRCTETHRHATESPNQRLVEADASARTQVQILSFGP